MKLAKLLSDDTGKQEDCPFMRLTDDLILLILLRLPIKSVGRCSLVSKAFNSLISDPKFPNAHLEFSNETKPSSAIVLQRPNVILKLELEDYMDITKGVRLVGFEDQFPSQECEHFNCYFIGSCHGLVCIYLTSHLIFNLHLMFLWNPIIGKRQEISLPKLHGTIYLRQDACWFGYLPSINEYKIFLSYLVDKPNFQRKIFLYSFSTSTWREICVTDEVSMCFASGVDTIFVSEALHCLSEQRWICKFDLVEETFKKIPLLIAEADFLRKDHDISLAVIGKYDRLCLVFVHYHFNLDNDEENEEDHVEETLNLEVWMLQEYGNFNYWKKWVGIEIGFKEVIFGCTLKVLEFVCGDRLCCQGENGLIIIDAMKDPPSYAIARIGGYDKVRNLSNYVESLICPVDLP